MRTRAKSNALAVAYRCNPNPPFGRFVDPHEWSVLTADLRTLSEMGIGGPGTPAQLTKKELQPHFHGMRWASTKNLTAHRLA